MSLSAYANVIGTCFDQSSVHALPPCAQHLQSARQFSCGRPHVCSRNLRPARRLQRTHLQAAAVVEAPPKQTQTAAPPSSSKQTGGKSKKKASKSAFGDDGAAKNPDALYQHFDALLKKRAYSHKQGDKVTGSIFQVDERNAYVDIGGKAPALCPVEECTIAKVQRVRKCSCPVSLPPT